MSDRLQEEAQAAADNAMMVELLERAERAEFERSQQQEQLDAIVAGLLELADAGLITESRAAEIAGVRIDALRACDATSHQKWKLAVEQRVATERERVRQLLREQDQLLERNNELRQRAEEAEKWLKTNRKHWDDEKAERQRLERVEAELTPPPGHIAVMLPRADVKALAEGYEGWSLLDRVQDACRKALEADDE